jgi:hypothetical protein
VLIDAGATLEPPRVIDASVPEVPAVRPSLAFRIRTQKADGWLRISCAERLSEYRLDLLNSGSDLVRTVADDVVSYDVLTSLIVELIDDGRWRFAKVEYTGTNVN